MVFLDCGNLERNPAAEAFARPGARILNIDHHHDNTRFGTVNLVVADASCTAEIVYDLMAGLGVTPTRTIAEALYVGLITDTGRFMYENTSARSHMMAAELISAGVDVHEIYRRVYEGVPFGKLALLARGLTKVERFDSGRLTVTGLDATDFAESGAEESYSEGVIDYLRAVEGTAVAALVRARIGDADGARKVSLRASDERVDVSRIARAQGGGGHRQAAGFTTGMGWDDLVAFLREQVAEQLAALRDRSGARAEQRRPALRQAGWDHVARRCRAGEAAAWPWREGGPCRDARSIRDRVAARPGRARHPCPAIPDGAAQALRGRGAVRCDVEHRRSRGRDPGDRRRARRTTLSLPTGASCASGHPAVLGGERSAARRAYALARAGVAGETAEREVHVYRFEERWVRGEAVHVHLALRGLDGDTGAGETAGARSTCRFHLPSGTVHLLRDASTSTLARARRRRGVHVYRVRRAVGARGRTARPSRSSARRAPTCAA